MLFRTLVFLFMISLAVLFPGAAKTEESPAQKETPVFTNKDIEKYKQPSDDKQTRTKKDKTLLKDNESEKLTDLTDWQTGGKEYWCKKATLYKRNIERAQDDVQEAEKELSADNVSHKKRAALEKKLKKANKKLRYTERDLADLEDEAHRKEIPPGWLRCQFE